MTPTRKLLRDASASSASLPTEIVCARSAIRAKGPVAASRCQKKLTDALALLKRQSALTKHDSVKAKACAILTRLQGFLHCQTGALCQLSCLGRAGWI